MTGAMKRRAEGDGDTTRVDQAVAARGEARPW